MNQLHPPFNNPKVRQAVLEGGEPGQFMAAMGYPQDLRMRYCATYFICGSPNETSAGAEPWRTADVAKAKQMLAESGYKGEKVVLLVPSDITYLNAEALMAAADAEEHRHECRPQTWTGRRSAGAAPSSDAPEAGGWNAYVTVAGEFDIDSPDHQRVPQRRVRQRAARLALQQGSSTTCAPPGSRKPCRPSVRSCSTRSTPRPSRRCRTSTLGQYSAAAAARKDIKGAEKLMGGLPFVWYLDK